ncbi:hypothetical protein [Chryseobacterium wanjuense]
MKILFTKNIDQTIISKELGEDILVCIEVIKTNFIKVNPFDLKNYSLIFTSANGVTAFLKIILNLTKILQRKITIRSIVSVKKQNGNSENMVSELSRF